MGRILLVTRLALRDLRRRSIQALLLLLVMTVAMAALTLGLVLHGVTTKPYEQTRMATAGPDVVASSVGFTKAQPAQTDATALAHLMALAHAPGVAATSGPYPVAWPTLRVNGITADVMAQGRDEQPAAVDQPKVTQGTWVRSGGVVLERAFADALRVHVGENVTIDGRPMPVVGIAVTAAIPVLSQVCFYGGCSGQNNHPGQFNTGAAWLTRADAGSLATPDNPLTYYLNLRLNDPGAAPAFVAEHQPHAGEGLPPLTAWQTLSDAAATLVQQEQQVLQPASWLLALLAVASIAVVAGSWIAEQEKRVGLLKAAGGTPRLVAGVLLTEYLIVALAGAIAGLATAWLAAPLVTSPGASLVGTPGAPSLNASTILIVVGAAVAVAATSTLIPAIRAANISTVAALAGTTRPPRRRSTLTKLSAWLPVPLLLGLRLVARHPRRVLLSTANLAVTAATLVAVFVYHATMNRDTHRPGPFTGAPDPGQARVSEVMLVLTVVMAVLAGATAIFTTWATVVDSRRFSALTRALGATPRQTVGGISAAQLLPTLAGSLLGIPIGTALYAAVQTSGGHAASPPLTWLLAMVVGMLVAVAALVAVPALIGARRSIAEVLQSE